MTALVSAETGGTGGISCDQPAHSHWKGQRYNYTHQRKSSDSENRSLLHLSAAAQVARLWLKAPNFVFQTHRS